MNRVYRYSLVGIFLLGVVLLAAGANLWNRMDDGSTMTNWIAPSTRIIGNGNMPTWGVAGIPAAEPDAWHFHVVFSANRTATIALVWNLNETTLFEKSAVTIDESFNVALPRTAVSWRWDWVIMNPDSSVLRVYNFTVTHYPITYPERQLGLITLVGGFTAVLAVPIAVAFLRHRDIRRG
jgi:hypothetical protein